MPDTDSSSPLSASAASAASLPFVAPTIDPIAAARWQQRNASASPWLHEEVAQRMQERLQWLRQPPAAWCHWEPVCGGLQGHTLVTQRYPQADCTIYEVPQRLAAARAALAGKWWHRSPWRGARVRFEMPEAGSAQMLWANMTLHMAAQPQALLQQWHHALAVDGLLMFSCLGPDTLRELHDLYHALGWPPAGHTFTDMHDWGDVLLESGFADPVMDMERITLTFASASRALQELRELGLNLHPQRFAGLRGRRWRARLEQAMTERLSSSAHGGHIALTFEVIYGQAFKPAPRAKVQASTSVSLEAMREMLRTRPAASSGLLGSSGSSVA